MGRGESGTKLRMKKHTYSPLINLKVASLPGGRELSNGTRKSGCQRPGPLYVAPCQCMLAYRLLIDGVAEMFSQRVLENTETRKLRGALDRRSALSMNTAVVNNGENDATI